MYTTVPAPASLSPMGQAAWAELEPLIRRVVREEHERAAAPKPAASKAATRVLLSPESLSDRLQVLGLGIPPRQLSEMMRSGQVPSISLGIETGARDLRRFYVGWLSDHDGAIVSDNYRAHQRLTDRLLTVGQLAAVLDVSAGHVRNMLAGGRLPLTIEGRAVGTRYSGADLANWLITRAFDELSSWQGRGGNMAVFVEAGRS